MSAKYLIVFVNRPAAPCGFYPALSRRLVPALVLPCSKIRKHPPSYDKLLLSQMLKVSKERRMIGAIANDVVARALMEDGSCDSRIEYSSRSLVTFTIVDVLFYTFSRAATS
jgi:hypothetical protein